MILVDSHVHSRNSSDGRDSIADILAQAKLKGLSYLATTDHLDLDIKYGKNKTPVPWKHIDLDAYQQEWQQVNAAHSEPETGLQFCFGIEAGFYPSVSSYYMDILPKYPFDVVINSVHCVGGWDVYFPNAFLFKSKAKVYASYLESVYQSLDAPYHYDIVGHMGYVTRNAPYRDKELRYADFKDEFDAILKKIIEKDKALEVNARSRLYPPKDVLERYFELGGRKLSFGSDSHKAAELCKDFVPVSEMLLNMGFTDFTVYKNHQERLIPITNN